MRQAMLRPELAESRAAARNDSRRLPIVVDPAKKIAVF